MRNRRSGDGPIFEHAARRDPEGAAGRAVGFGVQGACVTVGESMCLDDTCCLAICQLAFELGEEGPLTMLAVEANDEPTLSCICSSRVIGVGSSVLERDDDRFYGVC